MSMSVEQSPFWKSGGYTPLCRSPIEGLFVIGDFETSDPFLAQGHQMVRAVGVKRAFKKYGSVILSATTTDENQEQRDAAEYLDLLGFKATESPCAKTQHDDTLVTHHAKTVNSLAEFAEITRVPLSCYESIRVKGKSSKRWILTNLGFRDYKTVLKFDLHFDGADGKPYMFTTDPAVHLHSAVERTQAGREAAWGSRTTWEYK